MSTKSVKSYFKKGLLIVLVPAIVLYLFSAIFRAVDGLWHSAVYKIFHFDLWPGIGFAFTIVLIFLFGWLASLEKIQKNRIVQFVKSLPKNLFFSQGDFLQDGERVHPAVMQVGEVCTFVFVMGRLTIGSEKFYKVFLPTEPAVVTGYLFIVPENKVKILQNSSIEVVRQIMSYGIPEIDLKMLPSQKSDINTK